MKRILTFIAICFGISGCAAVLFYCLRDAASPLMGKIFAAAYMFIPLISVVITQLIFHEKPLKDCGINFHVNAWWVVAWLVMPLICFGAIGLSLVFPSVSWNPAHNANLPKIILLALAAGATVNMIAAMGEEVAWRGYLVQHVPAYPFWLRAILIGVIWGVWHAPLILMGLNYPEHPVWGVGMMVVFCVLMSPILLFIREKSGSTIAAAIAHGTLNATAGLALLVLTNYQSFITGMTGVAGVIVLLVVNGIIQVFFIGKK